MKESTEGLEEGTKEKKFLEDIAKKSDLTYYDVKWLTQEKINELIKLANAGNEIKAFKVAADYVDPVKLIEKKGYKIFDHEPVWQRFSVWIAYKKGVKKESLEEASGFAYDIQRGTSPHEFIADFDEIEGTHVGDWMSSIEAMQRLMKAANTNSYEFKEVVLPKTKANTKDEVEKQWKTKGYRLFDYAITKKGETFLLFYKKA